MNIIATISVRAINIPPLGVRIIIALSAFAAISAVLPAQARAEDRLKVIYSQFTMTNSVTWFAREAGLFERHGLSGGSGLRRFPPAVQALTAGAAPLATMSGGLAVGPYLNGLDLVMLAGWANLNSYQLITRPEIRRVEDLRGKVIGIGRFGAAADWGLRLILASSASTRTKTCRSSKPAAAVRPHAWPPWRQKSSTPRCSIHRKPCRRGAWDSKFWLTASSWAFRFFKADW